MGTARCCCACTKCRIAQDKFNRDNDTDLGNDWTEESGDWHILSNELVTTDGDALALHQGPPPDGPASQVVTVDLKGEDAGDELRVWIATTNEDDGLYAQLTIESQGVCGALSLHSVVGGTHTQLATTVVADITRDTWHTLRVCFRGEQNSYTSQLAAVVTTSRSQDRLLYANVTSTGNLAGLGTGGVGTRAYFDNFCWQRHYVPGDHFGDEYDPDDDIRADPECPNCSTTCMFMRDDFTRTDSDNIGCEWEELTGSWDISGGKLRTTAQGYLRSVVAQPNSLTTMFLQGQVTFTSDGEHVRAIIAMQDQSNYLALEMKTGTPCGTARLVMHSGGVDTALSIVASVPGLTGAGTHPFWVCFGRSTAADANHYLMGYVNGVSLRSPTTSGFGSKFGLSVHSMFAPIYWDNLSVQFTYDPVEHPTCNPCNRALGCIWAVSTNSITEVPCTWTVNSGTWLGFSTTSSDAQVTTVSENPYGTSAMQATGNFSATGDGDEAKVILAGGQLTAIYRVGVDCGTITLSGPAGGASIVVGKLRTGTNHYFCVVYDGSTFYAGVVVNSDTAGAYSALGTLVTRQVSLTTSVPSVGLTGALGTGSVTGTVTFRDVQFEQYYDNSENVTCPWCHNCTSGSFDSTNGMKCEFELTNSTLGGGQTGPAVLSASGQYAFMNGGKLGATFVSATFTGSVNNQRVRVHVANDSSRSGPWAEILFGAASSTFNLSSGHTSTVNVRTGDTVTLWICAEDGGITATLNPTPGSVPVGLASLSGTGAVTGTWGGISSQGAGGNISVSAFAVARLTHGITGVLCNRCYRVCNACSNGQFPAAFSVEVVDLVTVFPSDYNGVYVAENNGPCTASFDDGVAFCTDHDYTHEPGFINVVFTDAGANIVIDVVVFVQPNCPFAGSSITYQTTVAKPFDCTSISNLVVPTTMGGGSTSYVLLSTV